MTDMATSAAGLAPKRSSRMALLVIWTLVAGGLLLVGLANWHLVSVALTSEAGCVSHIRLGESPTTKARFSAAESSCSPEPAEVVQPDAKGLPR
jgi:hypothetical protein